MREMINMVVVLTVLSAVAGGMLSTVKSSTEERIENQVLKFQKAPAIAKILPDASNNPLQDRFKITDADEEITFFVGKTDGKPSSVCFETKGKGYGGDVGLMVGIDITSDTVVGCGVTTHAETPGLGSRAKDDPKFVSQFEGKPVSSNLNIKNAGGEIDAMSGATVTSKAVAMAAVQATDIYLRLKPEITKQIEQMAN